VPIVDGKYEAKISTTYATPQEGIDEIKRMIQKSRRLRISGIPMPLLDELKPLLKDKDLMIVLPQNEKSPTSSKRWRRLQQRKPESTWIGWGKKQTVVQLTLQAAALA